MTVMRITTPIVLLGLLSFSGQGLAQEPMDRLRELLPPEAANRVMETIEQAVENGLPGLAIANRALEGAAKRRSGDEIMAAALQLASDLGSARDVLRAGGREPQSAEIEAAALALGAGVSGEEISSLASYGPSGRSLVVPLTVLASLMGRDLPSDEALKAVRDRLAQRAGDEEFARMPRELGQLPVGARPGEIGPPIKIPARGMGVPAGPPDGIPASGGRPGGRPGLPIQPPPPPVGRP